MIADPQCAEDLVYTEELAGIRGGTETVENVNISDEVVVLRRDIWRRMAAYKESPVLDSVGPNVHLPDGLGGVPTWSYRATLPPVCSPRSLVRLIRHPARNGRKIWLICLMWLKCFMNI